MKSQQSIQLAPRQQKTNSNVKSYDEIHLKLDFWVWRKCIENETDFIFLLLLLHHQLLLRSLKWFKYLSWPFPINQTLNEKRFQHSTHTQTRFNENVLESQLMRAERTTEEKNERQKWILLFRVDILPTSANDSRVYFVFFPSNFIRYAVALRCDDSDRHRMWNMGTCMHRTQTHSYL